MPIEPTTSRGHATRERIVRAASELTAAHGANGTAVDAVCARAQISKSQLYHYFEDRGDLIRAVVAETNSDVMSGQADLLAGFDSFDGILEYLDAIVGLQVQCDAHGGCPIGSLAGQLAEHDKGARLAINDGLTQWETGLRVGLEAMVNRGELRPDTDPAKLATQTLILLQGGLLLTQVRRDPGEIRIAADAIIALVHVHLTARGPDTPGPLVSSTGSS